METSVIVSTRLPSLLLFHKKPVWKKPGRRLRCFLLLKVLFSIVLAYMYGHEVSYEKKRLFLPKNVQVDVYHVSVIQKEQIS